MKTWQAGDTRTYHGADVRKEIFAGLFWYHGLGSGEFFAPDGTVHFCTRTESQALAAQHAVNWIKLDSFACFVPTALGDR